MSSALHLTADSFAAAVATSHDRPVLVDFWAPWCGPCKAQAPILDQLANSVGERAVVAKLDVDDAPEASAQFNVRSIPTLIVLRHGREVARFVGVQTAATLTAALAAAA
ncbi:MAG: thioredoxin [Burkholderiales bacterium]|nr:thioredoxin [Opitutaceae bacterium]